MSAERARPTARPATPPQSNHRQAHQMLLQIPTRCKLLAARSALEPPRVLNSATVVGQRTAVLEDLAWGRRGRAEQRCPVGFSHGDRVNLRVRKYSRLTVGSRKSHRSATCIAYQQHVQHEGQIKTCSRGGGQTCALLCHTPTMRARALRGTCLRELRTPQSNTHSVCECTDDAPHSPRKSIARTQYTHRPTRQECV